MSKHKPHPREVTNPRSALLHAADIVEGTAAALVACNTADGNPLSVEEQRVRDREVELAQELRRIAYQHPRHAREPQQRVLAERAAQR